MIKTFLERYLLKYKIEEHNLILLLSFFIGIATALAAFILKYAVHFIHQVLAAAFDPDKFNFLYLIFPIIGILITVLLVKYLIKDNIGHGVSKILYAISKKQGRIKRHNNWSSILASAFTIGFGGSVGAEAPIVLTGASLGSNLGKFFRVNHKTLILLIGCGAAGAIGGIFKAPIAGVVFVLEVLLLDLTMASLIPLLISAVTAASVSYMIMGKEVLFSFSLAGPFNMHHIPYVLLLGIITGLFAVIFTRMMYRVEGFFNRMRNQQIKLWFGGIILSLLVFFFPSLYGEGYTTIIALLNGKIDNVVANTIFYSLRDNSWFIILYLTLVLFFKTIATSTTTGAGGVGGVFAPSLFLGGITGFVLAFSLNTIFGLNLSLANFTLVGMAGMMAGVMHAPLTGIFLIAEITGGYGLFLPLMMTSVISFITINYFEPHSIYHKRLAERGELLTRKKDKAVLTLLKLNSVIETDLNIVPPNATLGDLVKIIAKSNRNIFPVVDAENNFYGIILLDDIRNLMFRPEKYDKFYVSQLMVKPPAKISSHDAMEQVMETFERSGAWNLPVIDDGKYVGFVSKARIFNSYRKVLVHYSDE